jgi:uncharacterized protein (DUF305 family)
MDPDAAPERRPRATAIILAGLTAAVVAGAGACSWGTKAATATPGPTSAEAGFARDMQVHHLQGVDLAMIVRDRSADPDIRRMAYDMATTQAHQAGQLYGWLAAWGLRQFGSQPPMTWMGHTAHGMGALMPGMATPEQMSALSAATGLEAERQFLRLMIAHHRGALEMAEAVIERTGHPAVLAFARGVLLSQRSETALMTTLLEEREKRESRPASR